MEPAGGPEGHHRQPVSRARATGEPFGAIPGCATVRPWARKPKSLDRDLGKQLGNALRAVGIDATNHIYRYPNADAESVPDRLWIREAAAQWEVILTRDGAIRRREAELAVVVEVNARCFVFETGTTQLSAIYARSWPPGRGFSRWSPTRRHLTCSESGLTDE